MSASGERGTRGLAIFIGVAACSVCGAQDGQAVIAEDGSIHTARSTLDRLVVERQAAGPQRDVAIVAAASGDINDPFFTDPRDRLILSGQFSSVTVIDAGVTTPDLAELLVFDAVLVWSNLSFASDAALGDALADYVDAGGGVVIAVFANASETTGRFLTGRWQSHAYEVIVPATGTASGNATLGNIVEPGHPLALGVTTFDGGDGSFRPATTSVYATAQVVAEWDDTTPLLTLRDDTIGSRVDVGFYPPSNVILGFEDFLWDDATDGATMLVNALVYASDRAPLAPGDANGDGTVDQDDAVAFDDCFTGQDNGPVVAGCVVFDFDADDDVDCDDWVGFNMAYAGAGHPLSAQCGVIPTLSEWGLIGMVLTLLAAGAAVIQRRSARAFG